MLRISSQKTVQEKVPLSILESYYAFQKIKEKPFKNSTGYINRQRSIQSLKKKKQRIVIERVPNNQRTISPNPFHICKKQICQKKNDSNVNRNSF